MKFWNRQERFAEGAADVGQALFNALDAVPEVGIVFDRSRKHLEECDPAGKRVGRGLKNESRGGQGILMLPFNLFLCEREFYRRSVGRRREGFDNQIQKPV